MGEAEFSSLEEHVVQDVAQLRPGAIVVSAVRLDLPTFDPGLVAPGPAAPDHGVGSLCLVDAAPLIVGGSVTGGAPYNVVDLGDREILKQRLEGQDGLLARGRLQVVALALVLEGLQAFVQRQFFPKRQGSVGDILSARKPKVLLAMLSMVRMASGISSTGSMGSRR